MDGVHKQTMLVWRAAFVLCVLLFGAIAPAAKLALLTPVTCGMECCEASGVCYCQHAETHAAETAAETTSPDAKLSVARISPACRTQCAQLPASIKKHFFAKTPSLLVTLLLRTIRPAQGHTPRYVRDALIAEALAPHPPPVLTHT